MKISKKVLSLLMAIAMVVTMLPTFALNALADEPKDRYLFSYFTGNSTEQQRIKFALSEDGNTYYAINKNDPIIKQNLGTGCCRDPYIFKGQDGKYYAIATDMDASGGWWGNSNSFVIWRSDDLITWGNETVIRVDQITGVDVYRAWAPQVIWDSTEQKYMIYFGLAANGYSAGGTKMHYMYTDDLLDQSKYTVPAPMMKNNAVASNDSIDGDITYYNGTYYMFFKDEGNATICIVKSNTIQGLYNTDNIVPLNAGSSIGALEGCQVWWNEDTSQYVLMADRYSANGVFACYNIGANLDTFYDAVSANSDITSYYNSTMSDKISVLGPRHGSIINITESQYNAIVAQYGIATNEDIRYNFNTSNYVAENSWHYDTVTDTSGYTYDVMTNSGQYTYTYTDEHYICLNGSTIFINDPAVKSMLHENKWTVSFDVSLVEQRGAPIFALTSGDAPASSIDWIRFKDNGEFQLYKNGAYTTIDSTTISTTVEYTFTIVYTGGTIYAYKDGVLFAEDAIGTLGYDNSKPTNYASFGWTDTCGVSGVHGAYANVRFRNSPISANQVASETAIGNELLYRYNEGTAEIGDRINATDGGASGVTTSMNGARGASYTVAGWLNVGSSREGSLFSLGWGGTDDSKQYLNLREDGVINYCWGDGSTNHYFDSNSIYTFAENTWYYVQINIIPDGNMCHFQAWVDGVSVMNQAYNDGYYNMTDHSYGPHAFFLQNSIDVRLGTSNVSWWNAASNTKFDDFRVYTKAIDPTVLRNKQLAQDRAEKAGQSGASQGSTLVEAMGIFESRVAGMANNGYSALWTNLKPAYEAYKVAVRDEGTIGESDARTNLNAALADMEMFVPHTGTSTCVGTNFNVSNTANQTYYRNVVYSEGATNGAHAWDESVHYEIYDSYGALWKYGVHAYIYYPQCVLLYDGVNTPVLPVMAGFINKDHRYSVNMLYVAEDMAEFDLKQSRWYGYDDYQGFRWPTGTATDGDIQTIPTSTSNTTEYGAAETINHDADNDTTTYRIHKNGLEYTGTPATSYTCVSSTSWQLMGQYTYLASDRQNGGIITNATPDIVIINYKRLTDALSAAANNATNKGYLGDLEEKYKSGGLEGLFAAFDSATTLDPNTGCSHFNHTYAYNASGVDEAMDKAALQCANDIDASVKLLSNISITTDAATFEELKDAIDDYEEAMATMTGVHVHLSEAYKAYLVALEYVDAYEYGNRRVFENPSLAKAAQNLREATANMTAYTVPTADTSVAAHDSRGGVIKYANDTTEISSNYYQNIVYWGTEPGTFTKSGNKKIMSNFSAYLEKTSGGNAAGVNYPTTVLMYDGENTPKMPVFGAAYKEGTNNNRYLFFMYPTSELNTHTKHSKFQMDDLWHGESKHDYNGNTLPPVSWNTAYGYTARSNYTNATLSGYTYIEGFRSGSYWYSNIAANTMSYKGSGDTTNYYEKVLLPWVANIGSSYNESSDSRWATSTTPIYVINYKPLKDKINAISPNLTAGSYSVTNYKEGGLATWLAQLDSLTNIDPNQYEASTHPNGYRYSDSTYSYGGLTGTEAAVKKCGDDIKALFGEGGAASTMSNTPTGTADTQTTANGDYTALKAAIDNIETAPTEQGCIKNANWQAYLDAVDDARQAMSDIANADNNNTITGKEGYTGSDIATLATNLNTKINDLFKFANSEHPLLFSYEEAGTHDGYFQCNLNNSHILDDDTHETVTFADMSAYDELGIVYSTLDLTKYNDRSGLNAGKLTYNQVKTVPGAPGQDAQSIVDNGTFALIEAINGATTQSGNVKTFNVTFNVKKNGTQVATNTTTYDYGTNVTLDAAALYTELGDHVCDSWEVTINGKTKTIGNFANTMNIFVQSDVTVTANYVEKAAEGDKEIRLGTVTGRSLYEIMGTTASTIKVKDVNTITVDGKDYKIPNTIVYSITGWKVGTYNLTIGTQYTAADLEGYCYSEFLKLDPIVEKKYSDTDDTFDITLDGEAVYTDVPYDTIKSISSSVNNIYALVIHDGDKFIPIAYAKNGTATYEFYVVYDMDVYSMVKTNDGKYQVTVDNNTTTVDDETTLFFLDHKLPFVYSFTSSDPEREVSPGVYSKWVQNSAATMDGGNNDSNYKITEYGTLYTRPGTVLTSESMTVENVGSVQNLFKKVASSHHEFSNQWYYAIGLPDSNVGPVMFRSYVKFNYTYEYLDDNKNPQTRVVSAVAYGDLNTVYYNQADPSAS